MNREYWRHKFAIWIIGFTRKQTIPWSHDYPLANPIATNKGSTNHEMPLFSRLYPSFGYLRKIFPPRVLKYSLLLVQSISTNHYQFTRGQWKVCPDLLRSLWAIWLWVHGIYTALCRDWIVLGADASLDHVDNLVFLSFALHNMRLIQAAPSKH